MPNTPQFGTVFEYDADGTGTYTTAGDILKINMPKGKRGKRKASTLSDANPEHNYEAGSRIEPGEMKVKARFAKTQVNALNGIWLAGTTYYFRVKHPLLTGETTPSKYEFQGYLSEFDPGEMDNESDEAVEVEFAIQVSGRLTLTPGA
jgi:hypothetical protein